MKADAIKKYKASLANLDQLTQTEEIYTKWMLERDAETVDIFGDLNWKIWKAGELEGMQTMFVHLLGECGINISIDHDGALIIDEKDKARAKELAIKYGLPNLI